MWPLVRACLCLEYTEAQHKEWRPPPQNFFIHNNFQCKFKDQYNGLNLFDILPPWFHFSRNCPLGNDLSLLNVTLFLMLQFLKKILVLFWRQKEPNFSSLGVCYEWTHPPHVLSLPETYLYYMYRISLISPRAD